jgi:hypothetical protein
MKKHFIEIRETLSKTIEIKAESTKEAILIAHNLYKESKVILDESNYIGVEFFDTANRPMEGEIRLLIKDVIEYLIDDEEKHYFESNKPENHIFLKLQALKNFSYS